MSGASVMFERSTPSLAAVVLAAGFGTRLRPLTDLRPKALCPVNNIPLVDAAIARARHHTDAVAVNVHHHREQLEAHLAGRAHLSIEDPHPLGTAGALGKLRDWIDGRAVLVLNADAWHGDDLASLVAGWDGRTPRLLTVEDRARGDFGDLRYTGACLLPWTIVRTLEPVFSGLYDTVWAPARADDRLELVVSREPFFDCGTPADYHAANMHASGGENVVAPDAVVEGVIDRCVVWPRAVVRADEHLRDAIRADGMTVYGTNPPKPT